MAAMLLRSLLTKRAAGVSPRVPYQGHRLTRNEFSLKTRLDAIIRVFTISLFAHALGTEYFDLNVL